MTYEQVIKYFRTQVAISEKLGISQASVSNWKARKKVPPLQQLRIEKLTGGKLVAEKQILRPRQTHACP